MTTIRKSVGVALLCFLVIHSTTLASPKFEPDLATIYVGANGQDSQACGGAAAPCRTIQAAVDRVGPGGSAEIRIAQGTYTGAKECLVGAAVVCILNKQISLIGGYNGNWTARDTARFPVILDGQGAARVIRVLQTGPDAPRAALTLDGVTVQNGFYQAPSSGNDASIFAFGAGLFAEQTSLTVRDVVFRQNRAYGGNTGQEYGGCAAGGGLAVNQNPANDPNLKVYLERVTFDRNEAHGGEGAQRGGWAQGGGLFTYGADVRGSRLTFTGNKSYGGLGRGSGHSAADGEKADAVGGGASFQVGSNVVLDHVTATGNLSRGGDAPNGDAGSGYGGGFTVEQATVWLADSEVRSNTALGGDGKNPGTGASIGSGGGFSSMGPINTNIYIYRTRFIANTAKSGNGQTYAGAAGGGGVAITFSNGNYLISNCVFAQNSVDIGAGQWVGGGGGGLWLQGLHATVEYSTFADNRISDAAQQHGAQGLAIALVTGVPSLGPNTEAYIRSALIADHHSITTALQPAGMAALQVMRDTSANLDGGVWANNTRNDNSGDAAGWKGAISGLGSVRQATSAGFVAPTGPTYNYHLRAGASAKDCASKAPDMIDIDGEPRSFGPQADAGADEYWPFKFSVTARPQSLILDWSTAAVTFAGVERYKVTVHCPSGGSAPRQGECDKPIDVGKASKLTLTGLTDGKNYDVGITAYDSANAMVVQSVNATAAAGARVTYLPSVVK